MTISIEIREESARVAAVEYIKERLAQGRSLAKVLLETLDFESGRAFALSAVSLGPGEIAQYRRGHARRTAVTPRTILIEGTTQTAYSIPSASEQLADAIYGLLGSAADLCLLENSIARADDPWLRRAKSRLLFHGGDVYHALLSLDRDKSRINNTVRESERPPVFVGAVGNIPWGAGVDIASLSVITAQQLADFAKTVHCVFVGAYDGEGYVIWKKAACG